MDGKHKYKAVISDHCDEDDPFEFESEWKLRGREDDKYLLGYIAEDAAGQYDSASCYECSFPMDVTILSDDGRPLGTFSVDREARPHYSAYEKREKVKP